MVVVVARVRRSRDARWRRERRWMRDSRGLRDATRRDPTGRRRGVRV